MQESITIHKFLLLYTDISFLAIFYWVIVFFYSKRRNYLVLAVATAALDLYLLNEFGVLILFPNTAHLFIAFLSLSFCVLASELNSFRNHLSPFAYSTFFGGRNSSFYYRTRLTYTEQQKRFT